MFSKTLVFRALFLISLNFFVISTSSAVPTLYEALLGDEFDTSFDESWERDARELITSNATHFESVDCKDMNSRLSRGLKWMFANKINLNKTIKYRVHFSSRKQPRDTIVATSNKFNLAGTDFNIERRTIVIVHGFLSAASHSWIKKMTDALLKWGDVNVLSFDWSAVGQTVNYYKAAMSTRIVGYEIARFLHRVMTSTIESTSPVAPKLGNLHFVGHSLGSHISGVAAYDFHQMQPHWRVSRITGLDPALPCFKEVKNEFHLDSSDAEFVDIIHTSASEKFTVGFGSFEALGHVDFYPNGGKSQPGCSRVQGSIFNYIWVPVTPVLKGTCNHARSYVYFTESLVNAAQGSCKFWAHKWDGSSRSAMDVLVKSCDASKCTEMGINAELYPHRGTFLLPTSKKSPFCIANKKQVEEARSYLQAEHLNNSFDK